jgi:dATP/dGTP diphosphohydrolase
VNPKDGLIINPKDKIGSTKVSLTKLPAIATAWGAMAMMDGASKYGPYNFRDIPVQASIYVDAARRHLDLWFEGQEYASDSQVHHLGHALACCAILLDCQAQQTLIDDRPKVLDKDWYEKLLVRLSEIIKQKKITKETA